MAAIQYYDVILKPVVTEKSMAGMSEKKYTFLVHPEANKTMIKEAVEKMFQETWNDLRPDSKDKESYRMAYRGQQGHRDLCRTVRSGNR